MIISRERDSNQTKLLETELTIHLTARLAWHNDGWNGAVCKAPEKNTYCVGLNSYPGDLIARERNLEIEKRLAGCAYDDLNGYIPPCCYSYNAFGTKSADAASDPPDFFHDGADRKEWLLPPASVCVWPFEAMYADGVRPTGRFDNNIRRENTLDFFAPIERDCGKNLIFYYANYSNPLSEEEEPRYVIVGVSRIAKVGEELFYENVTPTVAERYAGGLILGRQITSNYPDEGLRLPYHQHLEDPEQLAELAVYPERESICKYGSKHVTDDEAIGVLEQFLSKVQLLKKIGDETENWDDRERWLLQTIAELWSSRGLYPGLLKTLDVAGATNLMEGTRSLMLSKGHHVAYEAAFEVLSGITDNELATNLTPAKLKQISRNWKLLDDETRDLLREIFPRLDLDTEIMNKVKQFLGDGNAGSYSAQEIVDNPYLLSETFSGEDPAERIPWSVIDRGALPSPELGGKHLPDMEFNDERRFRALCMEHLRCEPNHTFRWAKDLVAEIQQRIQQLPEWKQAVFSERYFEVDFDFLSKQLTIKPSEEGLIVYLRSIYEDERLVETTLRELVARPYISLRRPVTTSDWKTWIYKANSSLAERGGEEYKIATDEQIQVCERLFKSPLSIVTGTAGTGKTTVIEAIVRAVRRSEGENANILVMAPTGKAADRARQVFDNALLSGVKTVTVHSFLASYGWLNTDVTFRRKGGRRATISTLILDETSMVDLELCAALFRANDWQHVRRLILVGDAGQLPPIGRGRVFADVIKWASSEYPLILGRLNTNLRLLSNKIHGKGSAIQELSDLFIVDDEDKTNAQMDSATRMAQEQLIEKIHAGGNVDRDLNVVYWNEPEYLSTMLLELFEEKMNKEGHSKEPYEIWQDALKDDPTRFQILTPHRGEMHGVEAINIVCQMHRSDYVISRVGCVDGITLFDKVIQIRNRPTSDAIWAFNKESRKTEKVEIFNGEIGTVFANGLDTHLYAALKHGYPSRRMNRFSVAFTRKTKFAVGYGSSVPIGDGKFCTEPVEGNLELAYAVSIHKAQGSEFEHTFVIVPSSDKRALSTELLYTALTRATKHCTLLVENDLTSLLNARRRENAQITQINSTLFEFHEAKTQLRNRRDWYETGKVHEALTGDMLRSKSEVIIANLLHERKIPFRYEEPLIADDGTLRLPDFTVTWGGQTFYWEHIGRMDLDEYSKEWEIKKAWYEQWFPGQLVTTEESSQLSKDAALIIKNMTNGIEH